MKIILNILLFFLASIAFAQPNWTPVIYTNSTTAYAIVTINGSPATTNDIVGAFINNECRAVGNIVIDQGTAYSTFQIQGEVVETVNFKVYDASKNTIIDLEYTIKTNPGGTIGSPPNFLPLAANTTQTTELTITPINRDVGKDAGNTTFNISSNTNWSITKNVGWITSINPSSGSNNGTITVNYSANTITSQRQGTITVSGGGLTKQVTVTQTAQPELNYLFTELFNNVDDWILVVNNGAGSFYNATFDNETVGTFYMEGAPANVYAGKLLSKAIPSGAILKAKWYYESSGIYQNSENSSGGSIIFMKSIPNIQSNIPAATILTVFESRSYPMRQWNEEEFEISQDIPAGSYIVIGGAVWPSYIINHWDYLTISSPTVSVNNKIKGKIPKDYFLNQNYPNPFNPSTKISFGLPEQSTVSLVIYDITGKVVKEFLRNEQLPAGSYSYSFDASNLSSGIYIYKLQAGNFTATKKLILMK